MAFRVSQRVLALQGKWRRGCNVEREREILTVEGEISARSSPTYHAGVAMATHPVNASQEEKKGGKKRLKRLALVHRHNKTRR